MSTLYVVATPIGNLSDVSARALKVLKQVDLILAEDTRQSLKLLVSFGIKTSLVSYHQHSKITKVDFIIKKLRSGKDIALISDAGAPGISDPGNKLIAEIVKQLGDKVKITSVPGPSALTAAASISGFAMDRFLFLGFPPAKNKRKKFFEQVVDSSLPVILYESPHRILKTLKELGSCKEPSSLQMVLCRELTKLYETTYRGTAEEVADQLKNDFPSGKIKGEFALIINKAD